MDIDQATVITVALTAAGAFVVQGSLLWIREMLDVARREEQRERDRVAAIATINTELERLRIEVDTLQARVANLQSLQKTIRLGE